MVDIHSHIVWGLDDGATDMEQSLSHAASGGGKRHYRYCCDAAL